MKIKIPLSIFACVLTALSVIGTSTLTAEPAADKKPVQVYILSGQSNMVGMGDIDTGNTRWGDQFLNPVVSIYEGPYSATADYDQMTPIATLELEQFGGTSPTPFPGGGTAVVRGSIKMPETGVYEFDPGYQASSDNIMRIGDTEVYRREPGEDPIKTPIKLTAGEEMPFKITFLTENANGLGWFKRIDVPGTLRTLVHEQGLFPHLTDAEGKWVTRDDVFYKGVVTAVAHGPLAVGMQGNSFGPELQFGHVIGDHHDAPVLLIKSSQGNRSLGWDFLPPGSQRFTMDGITYAGYKDPQSQWPEGTEPGPGTWYAGKQYDDCFDAVEELLKNFDQNFPEFEGRGHEIAGFLWWQGHKDGGSEAHIRRYESNLVNLIKNLRQRFNAPKAPFVIATVGFGGHEMNDNYLRILAAQMAVSDPELHPDLGGTVRTVDIRDFWADPNASPSGQDFHYYRNAGTFIKVGDAMARAMIELKTGNQ